MGVDIDADRIFEPLFAQHSGLKPVKASQLDVVPCDKQQARLLVRKWHSRLPETQSGPWTHAFAAVFDDYVYGVALWNNPSARTLPDDWRELRRLAIPDDAPPHTASRMLGRMRRWFTANEPDVSHLISYQDADVHTGTIYRAAGWAVEYESAPRQRDRSGTRPSGRSYRWNLNGDEPDAAPKVRWGIDC